MPTHLILPWVGGLVCPKIENKEVFLYELIHLNFFTLYLTLYMHYTQKQDTGRHAIDMTKSTTLTKI